MAKSYKKKGKQFLKVYDKYISKIYRFIYLKVGSSETAEDLTSEVFTKGWDKFRDSEEEIKNLPAYLYQIARTTISNFYREGERIKIVTADVDRIVDASPIQEKEQENKSEIRRLREKLSELEEEEQNIVIWRFLDEMSFRDISEILNKPEATIRVILHRALKKLRGKLEG